MNVYLILTITSSKSIELLHFQQFIYQILGLGHKNDSVIFPNVCTSTTTFGHPASTSSRSLCPMVTVKFSCARSLVSTEGQYGTIAGPAMSMVMAQYSHHSTPKTGRRTAGFRLTTEMQPNSQGGDLGAD